MAFLATVQNIAIEFSVVLMLLSLQHVPEIIMKYVSLAAIAKIPSFYYMSLIDQDLLSVQNIALKFSVKRSSNPLQNASCDLYFMRFL